MLKILVTAGGTIAPIDEVRSIRNSSTGKFSAEITESWLRYGDSVTHLQTPGAVIPIRSQLHLIDLDLTKRAFDSETTRIFQTWKEHRDRLQLIQLRNGTVSEYQSVLQNCLVRERYDAVFLAAAVSDYEPIPIQGKIESSQEELIIRCRRVQKVIASVRQSAPHSFLVGFKLVAGSSVNELIQKSKDLCCANQLDLVVGNDLLQYRQGYHQLQLVRSSGQVETLDPGVLGVASMLVERVRQFIVDR